MKRRYIMMAAAAAMVSCVHQLADDRPTLSVSIEPQRKLLEELAGDNYRVVTILGSGSNPETYDPSVAQRMATADSKAYFTTGYLPFEAMIADGLGDNTLVVDTSEGIVTVTGTHTHGNGECHDDTDPHVWASVRNAKVIADNMTGALVTLDPGHADEYRQRNARLQHRLDSLDRDMAQRLSAAGAHAFMVWHPSLSYYARDYGLHQIAVGQESKEQSIGSMRAVIEEAKADSVSVFFFQREYDSRQAQSLNNEVGSRLVTISPLDYDWESQLIGITDELAGPGNNTNR